MAYIAEGRYSEGLANRILTWQGAPVSAIQARADMIAMMWDYATNDPLLVGYLLESLGFPWFGKLSIHAQKKILKIIGNLWQWRGSRRGLDLLVSTWGMTGYWYEIANTDGDCEAIRNCPSCNCGPLMRDQLYDVGDLYQIFGGAIPEEFAVLADFLPHILYDGGPISWTTDQLYYPPPETQSGYYVSGYAWSFPIATLPDGVGPGFGGLVDDRPTLTLLGSFCYENAGNRTSVYNGPAGVWTTVINATGWQAPEALTRWGAQGAISWSEGTAIIIGGTATGGGAPSASLDVISATVPGAFSAFLDDIPGGRINFGLALDGEVMPDSAEGIRSRYMYVVGGATNADTPVDQWQLEDTGAPSDTVWSYFIGDTPNVWRTDLPALPDGGMARCGAVVCNGYLYVIGGRPYPKRVYRYDPVSETWTRLSDMRIARSYLMNSVTTLNGKVLVVGGDSDAYGEYLLWDKYATAEIYDPATDTWSVIGSIKPTFDNASHLALHRSHVHVNGEGGTNTIYLFGGLGKLTSTGLLTPYNKYHSLSYPAASAFSIPTPYNGSWGSQVTTLSTTAGRAHLMRGFDSDSNYSYVGQYNDDDELISVAGYSYKHGATVAFTAAAYSPVDPLATYSRFGYGVAIPGTARFLIVQSQEAGAGAGGQAVSIVDVDAQTIAEADPIPTPAARSCFGIAATATSVYVLGGRDVTVVGGDTGLYSEDDTSGDGYDDIYVYGVDTGVWATLTDTLPHPMSRFGAVIIGNYLYAIGGYPHGKWLLRMNLSTREWVRLADMNRPRTFLGNACTVWEGKIVVVGCEATDDSGLVEDYSLTETTTEIYDPDTDTWDIAVQAFPYTPTAPLTASLQRVTVTTEVDPDTSAETVVFLGGVVGESDGDNRELYSGVHLLTYTEPSPPTPPEPYYPIQPDLPTLPAVYYDVRGYTAYGCTCTNIDAELLIPDFDWWHDKNEVALLGDDDATRDYLEEVLQNMLPITARLNNLRLVFEPWHQEASSEVGVSAAGCATYSNLAVVVGGDEYSTTSPYALVGPVDRILVYDMVQQIWYTHGATLSVARHWPSAARAGDYIYIVGGNHPVSGTINDVIEVMTMTSSGVLTGTSIGTSPNKPSYRTLAATVGVGDYIYVTGGVNGDTNLSDNQVYRVKYDGTWEVTVGTATMNTARHSHGAVVVGDYLYVIGGFTGALGATPNLTVERTLIADFPTGAWSYVSPVPYAGTGVYAVQAQEVDGKIYAWVRISGSPSTAGYLYEYDPDTDTWTQKTSLLGFRYPTSSVMDNGMYIIGDSTADLPDSLKAVYKYFPEMDT